MLKISAKILVVSLLFAGVSHAASGCEVDTRVASRLKVSKERLVANNKQQKKTLAQVKALFTKVSETSAQSSLDLVQKSELSAAAITPDVARVTFQQVAQRAPTDVELNSLSALMSKIRDLRQQADKTKFQIEIFQGLIKKS